MQMQTYEFMTLSLASGKQGSPSFTHGTLSVGNKAPLWRTVEYLRISYVGHCGLMEASLHYMYQTPSTSIRSCQHLNKCLYRFNALISPTSIVHFSAACLFINSISCLH